jgi:group II intron reverse transcriptase/maturase
VIIVQRRKPTIANSKAPKRQKLRNSEYYDLQSTFDKLYVDSKDGKCFRNLMSIITSEENIRLAYRNIKTNKGSKTAGVDGKTIEDLKRWNDQSLIENIQKSFEWYTPNKVRRVEIPKDNGKTRPLGIPTIKDRLIQQCIMQVLEPVCEAKFHERSNGFRPNRSVENAIAQAMTMIQQRNLFYVIDIDIKGFFDNVSHGKLLKQMWTLGIQEKKLLCIISTMLKAEIAEIGFPDKGTPQGGIISPLLSNIVLNELDWWIASQWEEMPTHYEYKCSIHENGTPNKSPIYTALRKTGLKECYIVRYADDFKVFCRKRDDAVKLFEAIRQWLKQRLGLDVNLEKSKIVNLKRHYSEFLGFKLKAKTKGKKSDGKAKYVVTSHISDKASRKILNYLFMSTEP